MVRSVVNRLQELKQRYAPQEDRPLGGYVAAMSAFAATTTGLTALLARRGGPPTGLSTRDLVLATIATYRASRLFTEASVTAPLRAPFTRYTGPAAPGEVAEEVQEADGGHRHAIGELVSCPYCLGVWFATGCTFGLALAPRWTRFVVSLLTVDAGSELLHKLYEDLQAR